MIDIIENIVDHIVEVKDFFVNFFNFFVDCVNMIPSPFKEILLTFLPIFVIIIGLKIWGDIK